MNVVTVRSILAEYDAVLPDDMIDVIVDNRDLKETISLVTYAYDLLDRLKGIAAGPAVLVLWRGFAWTGEGSPRKEFALSAEMILENERELSKIVLNSAREQRD